MDQPVWAAWVFGEAGQGTLRLVQHVYLFERWICQRSLLGSHGVVVNLNALPVVVVVYDDLVFTHFFSWDYRIIYRGLKLFKVCYFGLKLLASLAVRLSSSGSQKLYLLVSKFQITLEFLDLQTLLVYQQGPRILVYFRHIWNVLGLASILKRW